MRTRSLCTYLCWLASASACAAPPGPRDVSATDRPWDDGGAVVIRWAAPEGASDILGYRIYRVLEAAEATKALRDRRVAAADAAWAAARKSRGDSGGWRDEAASAARAAAEAIEAPPSEMPIGVVGRGESEFVADGLKPDQAARFRVRSFDAEGAESAGAETAPIAPTREAFLGTRAWFLPLLLGLCAILVGCIALARAGMKVRVRRIAGLDAIEEAVGRATEMGRPILYIPGIQDMDNVMTVAGVTILGRVARISAEYDARLEVPTSRSLVMTAARDVVQSAHFEAGRPDSYNPDAIRYITDEQFGFVAYAAGRMVRERPATCIYMGHFFAESLLLSETGNSINAIQIAGTAETSQLPFFVAACDYTLIGEEFFAASAYLSREPTQLGSLFGQDVAKLVAIAVIVIGVALVTLGELGFAGAKSAGDHLANSILAS